MKSTAGNPLPYLDILCHMLVKVVFDVFAHRVAKPEIIRLSPVANHRFIGFQLNAMKFPKNLRRLRYVSLGYLSPIECIEKEVAKKCSLVLPYGQPAHGLVSHQAYSHNG